MLRGEDGVQREVSWEQAMEVFTERFKAIRQSMVMRRSLSEHGANRFRGNGLSRFACEIWYGRQHGDGNTRQCMATAVVSYKQSFGFDAPPFTYQGF